MTVLFHFSALLVCCLVRGAILAGAQDNASPSTLEATNDNVATSCDQTLGTVTVEQVREMGRLYLEQILQAEDQDSILIDRAHDIIFQTATYDIDAVKICGSCHGMDEWHQEIEQRFPAQHRTYCDSTSYGYADKQSALIFLPREKNGDNDGDDTKETPGGNATSTVLTNTQLRAFLYMRATYSERNAAPTIAWPIDFSTRLNAILDGSAPVPSTLQTPNIAQFMPSMIAASSGSIAILPDYVGYGESTINPAYLNPLAYEQAAVVSFLSTKKYLNENHPCTKLDYTGITLQGMEDGALGAIFAARVLQRFGLRILSVFSGSGIFDMDTLIDDYIQTVDGGGTLLQRSRELISQAAFSFSVGTPGLANTGNGQDLVSDTDRNNLFAKYAPAEVQNATDNDMGEGLNVLNSNLIQFYRNAHAKNVSFPCKSQAGQSDATIGHLCQAIAAASAWPMLLNELQPARWIHNLELCFSPTDPVISPRQVNDAEELQKQDFVSVYNGPVGAGLDDTLLKPLGDNHQRILDLCRISSSLFYGLQGPVPEEDRPGYMSPLDPADQERCHASMDMPKTMASATPQLFQTLEHDTDSVRNLAWSPDGTLLASSTYDTVYIWSTETFDLIGSWNDRDPAADDIVDLGWSPDGQFLVVAENRGTPLKVYSTIDWKIVQTIEHSATAISSLEFSPNNAYLAISDLRNASQSLQLISTSTWSVEKTIASDTGVFDLGWSPDGNLLALGGRRAITYLNTSTWGLSTVFSDEAYLQYEEISWAPDGSAIAAIVLSASVPQSNVILIDTANHALLGPIQTAEQGNAIRTVDWSPAATLIASGMSSLQDGGTSTVFYGPAFNLTEAVKTGVETKNVAFNPDGSTLAVASQDGTVTLWTTIAVGEEHGNNTMIQCKDESECSRWCENVLIAMQECFGNVTSVDSSALSNCAGCVMDNDTETLYASGEISVGEYSAIICDNVSQCKDVCGTCFPESEQAAQCSCPSSPLSVYPTILPTAQPATSAMPSLVSSLVPSIKPSLFPSAVPTTRPSHHQSTPQPLGPTKEPTTPSKNFEQPSGAFQDTLLVTLWGMSSILTDIQKESFVRGTRNFLYQRDDTVNVGVISQVLLHSSRNLQGGGQPQRSNSGLQLTTIFSSWKDETPGTTASQAIAGPNIPGFIQQLQVQDDISFSSVWDVSTEVPEETQAPTSAIPDYDSLPDTSSSSSSGLSGVILFAIVFVAVVVVIVTCVCIRARRKAFRQTESANEEKTYDNFYATYAGQDQHHDDDDRRDIFFDDNVGPDDFSIGVSRHGRKAAKRTRQGDALEDSFNQFDDSGAVGNENRVSPERCVERDESLADGGMSFFGEPDFGNQSSTSTANFAIDGPKSGSAWG